MRTVPPARLPADIYEKAAAAGTVSGRTVPQQVAYWARIGAAVEDSPEVSQRDIERVLAGQALYDGLSNSREKATGRAQWEVNLAARRASLDLAAEFRAAGRTWTEADPDGNPVTVDPTRQ